MSWRLAAVAMLLGVLAIWGVLLFEPARAPKPAALRPRPAASAPVQAEEPPALRVVAPRQPAPAQSAAAPAARPSASPASIASVERDRQKMMGALAEARAVSERRFAVGSARWARESRDDGWASVRETRLRAALTEDGIDRLIDTLECRTTLCRVELTAHDSTTGIAISAARAFQREMGLQFGSGASGSGLDRRFVLFIAREGQSLDQ